MNNLTIIDNQSKIKSIDLVEIINQFRLLEEGKAELRHDNFMEKVRKEIEVLKTLGMNSLLNFKESSYINSQNKSQPCFELNRDGMLQMLNSESTYVRYKTIEYINELEKQVKQVQAPQYKLSKELQAIFAIDAKQQEIESRVGKLENTMTIDYSQQEEIRTKATQRVVQVLGGKDVPAYKELNKKAFAEIWSGYKREFNVNSYKNTAVKEFNRGLSFVAGWNPNRELELMIVGANSTNSLNV